MFWHSAHKNIVYFFLDQRQPQLEFTFQKIHFFEIGANRDQLHSFFSILEGDRQGEDGLLGRITGSLLYNQQLDQGECGASGKNDFYSFFVLLCNFPKF